MEEMKDFMRRANHVDDLIHRTDSPFIASITSHPLPSKFKMFTLDSYDGMRDPCDHIAMFKMTMHLQGVPNEIMCKRNKHPSSSLLSIEQGENESLLSFFSCFSREALLLDKMDDKILLAAFHNGVNSNLFIHKLYNKEPQTMAELIHSAQSFMNVEGAIIANKKKKTEQVENGYVHHLEQGPHPKNAKTGEKRDCDGKKARLSSRRYSNYTPLNTLLDQVLMQIKNELSLKWPEKMKEDPSKRNKSKYCHFH
ncbi:uncharacterized protein LOC142628060 [Castanea sativa]|uniref:uncharacterized protein LOC142628060 n=1 Tax=Castanea sativa TaxID=21020 RepID=UPI003F64BBEF